MDKKVRNYDTLKETPESKRGGSDRVNITADQAKEMGLAELSKVFLETKEKKK